MKILITGITAGLGEALALTWADQGHTIAGCGRHKEALDRLAKHPSGQITTAPVDVSSAPEVERWAQSLLPSWGVPDLLINNAAIINQPAPLWEVPPEEFGRLVDINIKGVYHLIRSFLPAMIARGEGIVVNLSSGWGRSTSPEVAPYCASKYAIEGLTASLAQEIPPGLAAIAVNPGVIDTAMLRRCFGAEAGHYPDARTWAQKAAPFLAQLTPAHNGQALTVPG